MRLINIRGDVHMKEKLGTKLLVTTSLLIAVSIVIHSLNVIIPVGGAPSLRISFDGIFSKLPGIIFGPFVGVLVGPIVDLLSYMIRPEGGYIPLLTLTAAISTALPAILWKYSKEIDYSKIRNKYIAVVSFIGVLGLVNSAIINLMPKTFILTKLLSVGKYTQYLGIGLVIIAALGFIFMILGKLFKNKFKNEELYENFFRLSIVVVVTGILVSTIDTFILRSYIPGLDKAPFMVLWIPRIVKEVLLAPVEAYFISVLLYIYNKVVVKKLA